MITTEDTAGHSGTQRDTAGHSGTQRDTAGHCGTRGSTGKTGQDYEVNRRADAEIQGLAHKRRLLSNSSGNVRIGDVEDVLRKQLAAGTSTPSGESGFTSRIYFAMSSVFSAPFFTPWPTALAPFFTPCPVFLAAVSVASPVLSAAFSVASPVFTAAFLVACPVFFAAVTAASPVLSAAFSVASPVFTAAFLVACPVSLAASFTSVPTWPYENALRARRAAAIVNQNFVKQNFVFIVPPEELKSSSVAEFYQRMGTGATAASIQGQELVS